MLLPQKIDLGKLCCSLPKKEKLPEVGLAPWMKSQGRIKAMALLTLGYLAARGSRSVHGLQNLEGRGVVASAEAGLDCCGGAC